MLRFSHKSSDHNRWANNITYVPIYVPQSVVEVAFLAKVGTIASLGKYFKNTKSQKFFRNIKLRRRYEIINKKVYHFSLRIIFILEKDVSLSLNLK
jgi:hypothetical protein